MFAFFWNMIRKQLPSEVIGDFDKYLKDTGIARMDANGCISSTENRGAYTVQLGSAVHEFHDAELAPPTGVFAENYARCELWVYSLQN